MANRNKNEGKRYHRKRNLTKGNTNIFILKPYSLIHTKIGILKDIENRFKTLTQWVS